MYKIKAMLGSRRFWLTLSTVFMVSMNWFQGRLPDPQAMEFIALSVGAWVVSDGLRETAAKQGYQPITLDPPTPYDGPIMGGMLTEETEPGLRRADNA